MNLYIHENFYCSRDKIKTEDLAYYSGAIYHYFRELKKKELFNWRERHISELDKKDHFFYECLFDFSTFKMLEVLHDELERFLQDKYAGCKIHLRAPDFYQVNINVTVFPKDSITDSESVQIFQHNISDQVVYDKKRSYFFKYLSDARAFSEKCKPYINNSKMVSPMFKLNDAEICDINEIVIKKKTEREAWLKKMKE